MIDYIVNMARFNRQNSLHLLFFLICALIMAGCGRSYKEEQPEEYDIYTVKVRTYLVIREGPGKDTQPIGYYTNGTKIEVYGEENGWAKVKVDNRYAYVSSQYIHFDSEGPRYHKVEVDSAASQPEEAGDKQLADNSPVKPDNKDSRGKGSESKDDKSSPSESVSAGGDQSGSQEESVTSPDGGTLIIANADSVFSHADIAALKQLHVPSEWTFYVTAVDSVNYLNLRNYTDDAYDAVKDSLPKESRKKLVLFSYIKESHVFSYHMSNDAISGYLSNYYYDSLLDVQWELTSGSRSSSRALGNYIDTVGKAIDAYDGMGWFKRLRMSSDNVIDEVLGGGLASNILPSDSWIHKYILGWLTYWPLRTLFKLNLLTGSLWITLIILIIILSLLTYGYGKLVIKLNGRGLGTNLCLAIVRLSVLGYVWVTVFTSLIYAVPDMMNVAIMEGSGSYPEEYIQSLQDFYFSDPPNVGWIWYAVMVVLFIGSFAIDPKYLPLATVSSATQRKLFKFYLDPKNSEGATIDGYNNLELHADIEKLKASEIPLADFYGGQLGENLGGKIIFLIFACTIFNGTLVIYSILILGSRCLTRLIRVLLTCSDLKKKGIK